MMRIREQLSAPVDNASLVLLRIGFGLLMCWNTVRYLLSDRVNRYYLEPEFHFKYYGFEWVEPLPAFWLHAVFVAMALLALMIAVGLLYRLSMFLFGVMFTYAFLLEQARYLNHYYLICLLCLLMVFVPAHGARSLDARLFPRVRSRTAPAWSLWLLRGQLAIVYFFAGVAKLNGDWLRGEPMRMWLGDRSDAPLVGSLFTEEWVVYSFSYGGLLIDLFIAPLLIWPLTRKYAFLAVVAFHVMNALLFSIGVFPWTMLAATTIFFAPGWPREFLGLEPPETPATAVAPSGRTGLRDTLIAAYFAVQILVPLRHLLYPGNVSWTEEGHAFSWHMKLRDKESNVAFILRDPVADKTWFVDPASRLTEWQARKMGGRPDMLLQFAHHLAREKRRETGHDIEVRVRALVSLNGRARQLLIDPEVDLSKVSDSLGHKSWVLPLREPLR